MYLLIRPLGSVAFRWGGVSSILLSGSISTGFFEPLPLPSTIYGLLKYAYVINGLGQEPPRFRGPVLYAEGRGKTVACVSLYPQSLYCNVDGEARVVKIEEDMYERRIGVALNRVSKTVKEGYIYMEKMLDLHLLARALLASQQPHHHVQLNLDSLASALVGGEPKKYGVLVEVLDEDKEKIKKLDGFVAPFGGESRPAVITVEDNVTWKKVGKRLLASPAIIDDGDERQVTWKDGQSNMYSVKFETVEGTENDKVTYRLISLGFEGNKRLPMVLALMPTVEIKGNSDAIGKYTDRGWGSVVEL